MLRVFRSPVLGSLALLLACGDDVGRDTAGGSGTTSASTLPTTLTPTTSGASASGTTDPGTGTDSGASASGTQGEPSTSQGGSDSGPKFDQGVSPDFGGNPGCGDTGGEPDTMFSYIWIANSGQGTVSKIITLKAANSGEYGRIQGVT